MTEKTEIEFFVAMNEDGDFEVAPDADDCRRYLAENCGFNACRLVKVTMKMAAPVIEEVEIEVPDSAGQTEVEAA